MFRRIKLRYFIFCTLGLLMMLYLMFTYTMFPILTSSSSSSSKKIRNIPKQKSPLTWPFKEDSDSLESQIDDSHIDSLDTKTTIAVPIYRDGELGNYELPNPFKPHRKRPGDYGVEYKLKNTDDIDLNEVKSKKQEYGMNMVASERIPMDRIVPDIRHEECRHWVYPERLPAASVVIVFHNEGFSTLLRTVHSVLLRSPKRFLREVLLVDDFSDKENLHAKLDDYIMEHFGPFKQNWHPQFIEETMFGEQLSDRSGKVRVIRNSERLGLIGSRAHGAKEALGEVVVFLDAHCEVNLNWLVPLLSPIAENNRTMTVPVIDGIDSETFQYRSVYQKDRHFIGIWEWGMLYKEQELDLAKHLENHRFSEPYKSPTHAGGLLAINKNFFFELGGYDDGLLVWGGENFELSFKVWQCGGQLLWVPCSRVGHIYRPFMPYSFGKLANKRKGPLVLINYKRVIEVWFDEEYKNYFYTREPMAQFYDSGDISKQLKLKKQLKCKSFNWFIQNHAKSIFNDFPRLPSNVGWGELRLISKNRMCLSSPSAHPPATLMLSSCTGTGGNQLFRLNAKGQFGLGERCVDGNNVKIKLKFCDLGTVNGPWSYDEDTKQLINREKCLTYDEDRTTLQLSECDVDNQNQKWRWKPIRPKLNG
ncbi:plexin-B [Sarcoptes scabiei]|nr:plexin-B [Sarcoptes scabiei]